jgi:4-hydroxybenzoate polyprenyltransferase
VLTGIYPFAKRFTHYPQVFLGFPLGWGVFVGAVASGADISHAQDLTVTGLVFLAVVLWTVTYDTIYAHQDAKDDVGAGVKSMALQFSQSTKVLAFALSCAQLVILVVVGGLLHMGAIYYTGTCGGTAVALFSMIYFVNLNQPQSCAVWFCRGLIYVGLSITSGLFGTYINNYVLPTLL